MLELMCSHWLSPLETEPWLQLVLDTTGPELMVRGEEAGEMMVSQASL